QTLWLFWLLHQFDMYPGPGPGHLRWLAQLSIVKVLFYIFKDFLYLRHNTHPVDHFCLGRYAAANNISTDSHDDTGNMDCLQHYTRYSDIAIDYHLHIIHYTVPNVYIPVERDFSRSRADIPMDTIKGHHLPYLRRVGYMCFG